VRNDSNGGELFGDSAPVDSAATAVRTTRNILFGKVGLKKNNTRLK
jgi:hypothetical protein